LAQLRRKLGAEDEARSQLTTALRQLNKLIGYPALGVQERSARLVERGKLLFFVGDTEQGAEDFRQARALTPDRAEAYAEPMQFLVNHGYYSLALEVFRQALPRDEGAGLAQALLLLVAARAGAAPGAASGARPGSAGAELPQ
jgi:lipoprotein NlpI